MPRTRKPKPCVADILEEPRLPSWLAVDNIDVVAAYKQFRDGFLASVKYLDAPSVHESFDLRAEWNARVAKHVDRGVFGMQPLFVVDDHRPRGHIDSEFFKGE